MANGIGVYRDGPVTEAQARTVVHRVVGRDLRHASEAREQAPSTGIETVPWRIETKYYSATAVFKLLETPDEELEVVIVLCQGRERPSDELAKLLEALSVTGELDVAILASLRGERDDTTDADAWDDLAIAHGFEWIDADSEQGLERMVEALQARRWDEMQMHRPAGGAPLKAESSSGDANEGLDGFDDDFAPFQSADGAADVPSGALDDDDGVDGDLCDYDDLVTRISSLRTHVQSLPMEQRREAAAAIVGEIFR